MLWLRHNVKSRLRSCVREISIAYEHTTSPFRKADIALFHEFRPPPGGGGHQFLRALIAEMKRRGLRVENNRISKVTRACLFNSFNFDFDRLRRLWHPGVRMVHRVDGPISIYRGYDDGSDLRIWKINHELADATILQSHYSLNEYKKLGLEFRNPVVIMNAADPTIFNPIGRSIFAPTERIRLISTSWSDNLNKGAAIYKWLDEHLDWRRFEYTYVGRTPVMFNHIRIVSPLTSEPLAKMLRKHHIFITASRNDPCSNSLIEALSCGLPALYLKSGGHPEIVGNAGLGFDVPQDIPVLLDQLVSEYEYRVEQIRLPTLAEVVDSYMNVMGVNAP